MPSLESSLRNLQKAKARWRPPRPWRSEAESDVIRRMVWQWFTSKDPRKQSGREVGRRLGVSHTYVQKLLRSFRANPARMEWEASAYGWAGTPQFYRAKEITRQQREEGLLRPPLRWRVKEFRVGDKVIRARVLTKAEERRMAAQTGDSTPQAGWSRPSETPLWAKGMPYYSPEHPCDPLVAVKHAMQQQKKSQPIMPGRHWRPRRGW